MTYAAFILICISIIFIYIKTRKLPIYKYSPADPSYTNKLIIIKIVISGKEDKFPDQIYYIENTIYVLNNMSNKEIIKYYKSHTNLYLNEFKLVSNQFIKEFNMFPKLKDISIRISED